MLPTNHTRDAKSAVVAHITKLRLQVASDHIGEFGNDIVNLLIIGIATENFFPLPLLQGYLEKLYRRYP